MIPHSGSLVLQRRLRIADAIRREGSVRVDALSERLGVSAVTVRGDLAYLEAQGMVLRGAGHARAVPGASAPEAAPPPPALLRAARALLPENARSGTVLLGPGTAALRLLPLLGEAGASSLLLCALDAVPVARACTDAALHLLGGAIGADGVIGGPAALSALASHEIALFVVEARELRGGAVALGGFAGGGEAFAVAAAARAARTAVLLFGDGDGGGGNGGAALLPLAAATDLLLAEAPGAEALTALRRAGLERDGGPLRYRRTGRRNGNGGQAS